jgi:branched-chain amino acid transport system permease protein
MSPRAATIATAAGLLLLALAPLLLPQFWLANILGRALVYGTIVLSLTFLASAGGFVSLAQMMVAGVAGYTVAILAPDATPIGFGWSYAAAIPAALAAATLGGLLVGAIAVRSQGIYLLMITLALAMGVALFVQANTTLFNGYEGIRGVVGPVLFGRPFRDPLVFHAIALSVAAFCYLLVIWLLGTPFGLALQGLRDSPRRLASLGYRNALHRIAAFGVAGFIAGCGGLLATFYNIGISPGSIGLGATINILIMAVIGGLGHPIGAFLGALLFTLLDTFAADLYDRDRFNTLVGLVFLGIVVLSPDGVLGLLARAGRAIRAAVGVLPQSTPATQPER